MKKILLAVDPNHLNQNTLAFGCYLARLTNSAITGVFLENLEAEKEPVFINNYEASYIEYQLNEDSPQVKEKLKSIKEKMEYFKSYFDNHCIVHHIHEDKGVPVQEIINESRYADLLVIDAEASFSAADTEIPGSFTRKMMTEAECPVVIAPLTFEGVDEIIFAYNGSESCMFAIKQFSDLFPELKDHKITVVEVEEPKEEPALYGNRFKEWMTTRFENIHYVLLSGSTDSQLLSYLLEKRKCFIVMGAYGRNTLSNFFKHSTADIVLKTTAQPIFIAHR